jgi:hypothetical protein
VRSLPLLLAVALVLGALTGCGSSQPKGVDFHSARGRYTVTQVEAAFAAQGIQLRLAHEQLPGEVVLHGGPKPPHLVTVLVALENGHAGPMPYAGSGQRIQTNGNVRVSFDPSHARPVKDALARLH